MGEEAFHLHLAPIIARFEELQAMMGAGETAGQDMAALAQDYAALEKPVAAIRAWQDALRQHGDAQALLHDPEMAPLARAEVQRLEGALPALEKAMKLALLPRDETDERSAILEVRPAAGGDEAALFAGELLELYRRYAESQGWRFEALSLTPSELGGLKEGVASITGKGVFAHLKHESGVHRVQRVPATESQGRIHTSTVTVAVLPEACEVDVAIDQRDLRIDVYRASGAGGQHVNKTESAVRITHLPTGVVVAMQEERSQHRNREKAMAILRARLFEKARSTAHEERASARRDQVGTGDRSERIRTYNFPQGRVTDHRINLTTHRLPHIMGGDMEEIITALTEHDQAQRLATLGL
ncbi:peptide chain release factor 1 [Formicincola oecophyllae]|uniref:Peptide chain release factor 1 n=1 Tax=Formicincola oecophyllae TaxID=2558361 RepID=A0A4Y6U8N8_9PROT|nr:peptide chain release factor 1 [Formicincola oecophyllae]QDH12938.1 peptide chain release factor 1 [Formicincola oecophyllae]